MVNKEIKSYKDLEVWRRSHRAALMFYKASIGRKRRMESYGIWSQGLDSAFSVPANIVEGFYGHKGKSFANSLSISRGSAGETQYWIGVLQEIGELSPDLANSLSKEYEELILMLSSIINKLR